MRRQVRRRYYFSDEQVWIEFYIALLPVVADRLTGRRLDAKEAATHADSAMAEFRKRFGRPEHPPTESDISDVVIGGLQ